MRRKTKKKFLVFSAHPDDLDFGCAATVALLTARGNRVVGCVVTNGEKGVHKVRQSKRAMIAMREREQRVAGQIVGISHIIFLRKTDGDLEHTRALRKLITRVIREVRPDIIIAPDPGNQRFDSFGRFHRDHRITAEVVFDAIYPAVGSGAFFPELAQKEILPHQIEGVWFYNTDRPNLFFNVARTMEKKIAALAAHESQIKDLAEVRERMYVRARVVGRRKGVRLAESFRRLTF